MTRPLSLPSGPVPSMSKTFITLLPLLAALTLSAPAQAAPAASPAGAPQKIDCERTEVESELLICAKSDFSAASKRYDALVPKARAAVPAAGRSLFDTAQQTWVAYRDADCAWNAFDPYTGKTDELMLLTCKADLTLSRIDEIEAGLGQ